MKSAESHIKSLQKSLPKDITKFDENDKIYYSQLSQKWIYEDEDAELEFIEDASKWQEVAEKEGDIDEEKYNIERLKMKKKQKLTEIKEKSRNLKRQSTTAVYIKGLKDISKHELEIECSKYGVISSDETGKKVKLYKDENGNPKGDALVVYHRPESVLIAVEMLDGYEIKKGVILEAMPGEFNNAKKRSPNEDEDDEKKRQKQQKKRKIDAKLANWDEKDLISSSFVVRIAKCFTIEELEQDAAAAEEIKEDMSSECAKFGHIRQILLLKSSEGAVFVEFDTQSAVNKCIKALNGRYFAGEPLQVSQVPGLPNP